MKIDNSVNNKLDNQENKKFKKPRLALEKVFKSISKGLQIYIEKSGDGPKIKKGSNVKVHYEGWLAENYKMFDSSRSKRRPFEFEFGTGKVISGWEKGLEGLRAGTKIQLKIPAKMAYGPKGVPEMGIPENADLIFKVEILKVK